MLTPDNQETRRQAAAIVTRGGVIAFRTDTFYGLGADPFNASAVKRIRELKGREDDKPILLLIADVVLVERLIRLKSHAFDLLAGQFWPGPLTLIGEASTDLPTDLTAGTGTVGVRLPDDASVRALVQQCGGALTATSANPSGSRPAESAFEVGAYFPTGVDLIIDGGQVSASHPSTVVDVSKQRARLIREGAVSRIKIERLLDS